MTPVFKKGEHYDPGNYRPVSLTCIACKIMEHIIASELMNHLDDNNILHDSQHGFRKLRSCETQLLELTEELTERTENGKQTDILVMDFSKAFDRVNHSLLLHKLTRYGVTGTTAAWIASFLQDRRQSVVVNGCKSSFVNVKSGVPQGSVLGPSLFLVYINDLPNALTSQARLFADDTAVYRMVTNDEEQNDLQQDLQRLEVWENSWDMKFHPTKCCALSVTRRNTTIQSQYRIHDHVLEKVNNVKYLGVTIQQNMNWDGHVNAVYNKANKTLGFLRRNLKISSRTIKDRAYKAFVRPVLEYASSVWDPSAQKFVDKLESIQRRAARFVMNNYERTSSVTDMLHTLGWQSLEQRRKISRLSMMFKVKNDLAHCPIIKSKLHPLPSRQRRSHSKQYQLVQCRTLYRASSFLPRTVKDWNNLSEGTVAATTLGTFVSGVSK